MILITFVRFGQSLQNEIIPQNFLRATRRLFDDVVALFGNEYSSPTFHNFIGTIMVEITFSLIQKQSGTFFQDFIPEKRRLGAAIWNGSTKI